RALHLVEELGERMAVDPRRRHVRTQPVGDEQDRGHQDPALQLGDLEDVLERLEVLDHDVAAGVRGITSTRPPFASILLFADSLTAWARTVRPCSRSPSPRIFTRARSDFLISPAWTSASGSTTLSAAKPASDFRLTIAYSVLPPWGRKPRLGS